MTNERANSSEQAGRTDSTSLTVLIAVDDDESMSAQVAETARKLFGGFARYFVIDVGEPARTEMNWGYIYPVSSTGIYDPPMRLGPSSAALSREDQAEHHAARVANAANLPNATALSDLGDPAAAILSAAAEQGADVIVVGSHHSGWFHRLFVSSVGRDLLAHSPLPVLVVK